jgi:hypothetical protein
VLNGILRRYPVPAVYVSVLGVVSVVYGFVLSHSDQKGLVSWASTNLANLPTRPVVTLFVSAFVSEDPFIIWAIATTLGLVLLVRRFGNLRALALVVVSHVAGTLVSEGIAALRLSVGDVPMTIRHIADVGPSYVTVSALMAVALYGRFPWKRWSALGCWALLAPFLFVGLPDLDVAAVGHATATLCGVLVGGLYVRWERRRAMRADFLLIDLPEPVRP